jgi:hypothetical protein
VLIINVREKEHTRGKLINERFLLAGHMFDRGTGTELYKIGVMYGIYKGWKINVFCTRDRDIG